MVLPPGLRELPQGHESQRAGVAVVAEWIEDVEQAVMTSADARPMSFDQRRDPDRRRPARRDTHPRRDAAGSIHIVGEE